MDNNILADDWYSSTDEGQMTPEEEWTKCESDSHEKYQLFEKCDQINPMNLKIKFL